MPDMRLPIQYALAHPRRLSTPPSARPGQCRHADVRPVSTAKYPCLELAFEAGRRGGTYPTVMNAANEVAVARFLAEQLGVHPIAELIDAALQAHTSCPNPSLEEVLEADTWARTLATVWQRTSPAGDDSPRGQ